MRHTPGPWRIGDAGKTVFGPKTDQPAPVAIASLYPVTPRCGSEERRANGHLLRAAPELLEALVALIDHIPADWWTVYGDKDILTAAKRAAEKAVGG